MPKPSQINEDDAILLGVLDAVERDAKVTQRHVAGELGIAVGLANAYVKRCIRKGWIKVRQAPAKRYMYYLTPKGFSEKSRLTASYLSDSLSFFRRAREQCAGLLDQVERAGGREVVLLGGGDLADIVRLLANDHVVKVVGVVDGEAPVDKLLESAREADFYVITSHDRPRDFLTMAVAKYGAGRVLAPALLRLGKSIGEPNRVRASLG